MRALILALWTVSQKPRQRREQAGGGKLHYALLSRRDTLALQMFALTPIGLCCSQSGQRSSLQIITMLRLNDS